jgi:hypothetical protein
MGKTLIAGDQRQFRAINPQMAIIIARFPLLFWRWVAFGPFK